ncbi:MAG: VCBS repeat-containing protein, partial [Kiritimatiellota bacterium]|nr:VCBS repeat-containing protein [Kiritimatiellota bacterium]
APTNVSASKGTYTDKIRITWNSASNATSYQVWRNTSNVSNSATKFDTEPASATFDDTNVSVGVVYYYWVKSKNTVGASGFSSSDSGYAMNVALAADFDGDGKADPVMVLTNGYWKIWESGNEYAPVNAGPFYVVGGVPVTGDFDRDGKADPCMVAANGVWKIWMSSGDYAPVTTTPLYVAGGTPIAADFDDDGKADPAMVAANGIWTIWMSSADYAQVTTAPLYVAGGAAVVAGDFDRDGKADPVMVAANGAWKIWMSSADYAPVTTIPLVP